MSTYRVYRAVPALAAVALLFLAWAAPAFSEGPRVAVFPIKNNGSAQYNGLATGMAAMFTTNLNRSHAFDVVEPQVVMAAISKFRLTGGAPSTDDVLAASAQLNAGYAVTGEFVMFGGMFRVDIRVYDVAAGQLKFSDKAQDKENAFFSKVDELSDKIVVGIAGSLPVVKGQLQVGSVPAGAQILIDGDKAGETPHTVTLVEPGAHEVELDLYGYQPYKETVVVKEGETVTVDAKLIPLYGGVRIWWKEQPTSDVSIGSTVVGAATFRYDADNPPSRYCRNLPAGTYRVSVRMPYKDETEWTNKRTWKTYSTDVEVTPGVVTDVYLYNKLFGPDVQVGTCGSCASDWDFNTDIAWYEQVR